MRLFSMIVSGLAVGTMCAAAVAQDEPPRRGGGGAGAPPAQRGGGFNRAAELAPEQVKAAWELQARHLSQGLGLNEEQTKNVVAAYIEVREKHAESMRQLMEKMREGRGNADEDPQARREEMQKSFEDLRKADREKLQQALTKSMTAEQVTKAMVPLGSFNSNWDVMVHTVKGFNLDQEKMNKAMDAMQSHATTIARAVGDTDPEARRTANQQARAKITEEMKAILTEDQFGQFQRTLGGPRAAGRRPGGEGAPAPGGRGGQGTGAGGRGGAGAGSGGSGSPGNSPR